MSMHVGPTHGPDVTIDLLEEVVDSYSWELLEALKCALAGAPHWRSEAQELLRKISAHITQQETE